MNAIRRSTQLAEQGQKLLLEAVEREARKIVQKYPFVMNYCQAMGSATVHVMIEGYEFDLGLDGASEIQRHFIWDELSPTIKLLIDRLESDMKKLLEIHDAWEIYSGSLAGEPILIEKSGKTLREWGLRDGS
jgi:hypothetical protein